MSADRRLGVLLMTFGSAVTSADVPAYLRSVRGDREPPAELVSEFARRFDVIGRSPLVDVTLAQAGALQALLNSRGDGNAYEVAAGMLHSQPSIPAALGTLVDGGTTRVVAIVLAPQYSPLILTGYERVLAAAVETVPVPVHVAGAWHTVGPWIDSLCGRVGEALRRFAADDRDRVAIVFTAHSLPRLVVERDPQYMVQVDETIAAVVGRLGLASDRWTFAFQSAGHTPEEWLKPDLTEVLADLRHAGATDVLVVPVQFVADHLEVLYDIDVAAAEQARTAGLGFHRIAMPNTDPLFVAALADVVDRELAAVHA